MTTGCIVRIVIPRSKTLGWQARRYLGPFRDPKTQRDRALYLSRFYADRKYGGPDKAYTLAEDWLDAVEAGAL